MSAVPIPDTPVLSLQDVHLSYGGRAVVRGLTLQLQRGSIACLQLGADGRLPLAVGPVGTAGADLAGQALRMESMIRASMKRNT